MFLVRRYINQQCFDLREHRGETWLMNTISLRPHIAQYVITEVAKRLGPLIFRFPLFTCLEEELATRLMVNIFVSNTDALWLPGQKFEDILIETGPALCHPGCICKGYE